MEYIIMEETEFMDNQKEIEEQFFYEMRMQLKFKVLLVKQWNAFQIELAKIQAKM